MTTIHPLVQATGRAFGADVIESAQGQAVAIEAAILALADLSEPTPAARQALMDAARQLSTAYGAFAAGTTAETHRWVRTTHGRIAARWAALGFDRDEPFPANPVCEPLTIRSRA
jgi:hypothetical protein